MSAVSAILLVSRLLMIVWQTPSIVLLVHIESVDPALLFHLPLLKVAKDLFRDKCRYQLPYLCCFHSLLTTSSSIILCLLNKGNLFSPPLPAHQNAN